MMTPGSELLTGVIKKRVLAPGVTAACGTWRW